MQHTSPSYDLERLARLNEALIVFRTWMQRVQATCAHYDIATTIANEKTRQCTGIDLNEALVLPYVFHRELLAHAHENQHH